MFCSKQITSKRVALRLEEEEEADPEDEDEEEEEDAGEEPLILFCFVLVLLCFALRRLATRERDVKLGWLRGCRAGDRRSGPWTGLRDVSVRVRNDGACAWRCVRGAGWKMEDDVGVKKTRKRKRKKENQKKTSLVALSPFFLPSLLIHHSSSVPNSRVSTTPHNRSTPCHPFSNPIPSSFLFPSTFRHL